MRAAASQGEKESVRIAMFELEDRTIEESRGVGEGGMGLFINQRVREVSGEGLGNDKICHVAAGEEQGIFGVEKVGEASFQFAVENVVACGEPRGGDVQAVFFETGLRGGQDVRVAREPKIVAAGKIGELAVAKANVSAVELLEGRGFGHWQ